MTEDEVRQSWARIAEAFRNLPDVREQLDIQPSEEAREGLFDLMTSLALTSEAAAAFARDDYITGQEHLDRSEHYAKRGRAAANGKDPDMIEF